MADDFPDDVTDEILDLLQRGDKLNAIKRYKDERAVSLAEAKAFIEQLIPKINVNNPQGVTDSDADNEISNLIYSGQKIEAVKRYRERRGTSLKEAKLAVEEQTARLREQFPDRFTASKSSGCAATALLLAAIVVSSAANALCCFALN